MKEEIDMVKVAIKELGVPVDRIKSIDIHWEKVFENKAFPRIHIELTTNSKYPGSKGELDNAFYERMNLKHKQK